MGKRLIGIYSDPTRYAILTYPNGDVVQHMTAVLGCEREGGELRISGGSTDTGYFNTENLPKNMLVAHRMWIEDALVNQVTSFIR